MQDHGSMPNAKSVCFSIMMSYTQSYFKAFACVKMIQKHIGSVTKFFRGKTLFMANLTINNNTINNDVFRIVFYIDNKTIDINSSDICWSSLFQLSYNLEQIIHQFILFLKNTEIWEIICPGISLKCSFSVEYSHLRCA